MTSRIMGIVLAAWILILGNGLAPAQQADFSGNWTLDTRRSEGIPSGTAQSMVVEQIEHKLNVTTTVRNDRGERTIKEEFVLDGEEQEFKPALNSHGKRTSKRSGDNGFDVVEEAIIDRGNGKEAFKVERQWRMSDDGQTLTIEMKFDEPSGPGTSKRVFEKVSDALKGP